MGEGPLMRKLWDGRVRRVWKLTIGGGAAGRDGHVELGGIVDRVTATLDARGPSYAALCALVRELVPQEARWLRGRGDDGSLAGGVHARQVARTRGTLAQQG